MSPARLLAVLLTLAGQATVALSQTQCPAPITTSADSVAVRQLEDQWGTCMVDQNALCLDSILAPEWVSRWADGSHQTKAEYLVEVANHRDKYDTVTTDSLAIRVFGPTAVVTGIDTERSTFSGRDGSGRYAWLDVFVKRCDKWQAVTSQSTKLP